MMGRRSTAVSLAGALFVYLVCPSRVLAQQSLTEFVTESELQRNIERWRISKESYYLSWYEKAISIPIADDASAFLVKEYTTRKLAPVFSTNRELARLVVKRDMGAVLDSAFLDSIRKQSENLAQFLIARRNRVAIVLDNIKSGLAAEDCNIIACPPDKCNVDCSPKSFSRFGQ